MHSPEASVASALGPFTGSECLQSIRCPGQNLTAARCTARSPALTDSPRTGCPTPGHMRNKQLPLPGATLQPQEQPSPCHTLYRAKVLTV